MKLEKWALISEIVGSVAIVVTLLFLIVEIRSNTEEMRAATLATVAARTQVLPLALMTNPEWAEVWSRMESGKELSPSQEVQVFGHVVTVLKLAEESYIAYRDGRLDEEVWQTRAELALITLDREDIRELWTSLRTQSVFIRDFVDWLDTAVAERYGP